MKNTPGSLTLIWPFCFLVQKLQSLKLQEDCLETFINLNSSKVQEDCEFNT